MEDRLHELTAKHYLSEPEQVEEVNLKNVKFAKATLPNASTRQRQESITQIGYIKGTVYVAGLSNEEFASKLRAIPFPFKDADKGASIEIYQLVRHRPRVP